MILIIHIHNILFHYFEFVKPIEHILKQNNTSYVSIHYKNLTTQHLKNADKIIIAGTSLKDNTFLSDKHLFKWINTIQTPLLGICGGMQLLASAFDESIQTGQEIGLHTIHIHASCLGETGDIEAYELHNNYVQPNHFDIVASSDQYPQIIKHPERPLYGILFHPEVRNTHMITYFIQHI